MNIAVFASHGGSDLQAIMLCYGITEEELKKAYIEKFKKNMTRW